MADESSRVSCFMAGLRVCVTLDAVHRAVKTRLSEAPGLSLVFSRVGLAEHLSTTLTTMRHNEDCLPERFDRVRDRVQQAVDDLLRGNEQEALDNLNSALLAVSTFATSPEKPRQATVP